ncbi:MAG: ATPase domain-containing protein [Candidatus Poseidoniaceae archaeon]|jgi:flagellar protein FlaH|tara:strand:- start:499 stop:1242 length:744 start_codon:yes stop_codon:yes gene_type:complete
MKNNSNESDPFKMAHKPVEDGFPYDLETDSLADSMGLRLPNRSLYVLQGAVGGGKSLVSQRLVYGMVENGVKVLVITTELTTRGWIEQMESIGYGITDAIREGKLMVFSRFGSIAESSPDVGLIQLLESEAVELADVVVIDSASSLMPSDLDDTSRFQLMQRLRQISSQGRSLMLCVDPVEMDEKLMHNLRSSAEVVLDLMTTMIGGEIKRNVVVTRYLRAAGPVQTSIGWRVEPSMGFIVDITAVS